MAAGIPYSSELVDISSTDHTFTARTSALICSAAGTVVARLRGDSVDRSFTVLGGVPLPGDFSKVTKSGTSAITIIGLIEHP